MRKQKVEAEEEFIYADMGISCRNGSVTVAGSLIKKIIWLPDKLTKEISIFVLSNLVAHLPSLNNNYPDFFINNSETLDWYRFYH